jgi:hypothetical protein
MKDADQANEMFDRALEECERFKGVIVTELGRMPIASERSRLASLFFCTALDHFRSITHLLDDGRYVVSAFALVRPVADASFRSVWISQFASDDEIRAGFEKNKDYRSLKRIALLMKKRFGLEDQFIDMIADEFDLLSGYVHTGVRQLKSRATASRTKEFPYRKAIAMLSASAFYLWLGACQFATSLQKGEAALRIDNAHNKFCEAIEAILQGPKVWIN